VQGVSSAAGGLLHAPVDTLQVPATWHASVAAQTTAVPVHAPVWQLSFCVHGLPSLQAVPFATGGLLHTPVVGLQTPAAWHWSSGLQVTLPPAVHAPAWQVAAHPVPQGVPLALFGFEHVPVDGLQTASWHASAPPHAIGFEPVHAPAWQVSVCVQALLSLQAVPVSGVIVHVAVPLHARVLH
jgi:hypothetical protein